MGLSKQRVDLSSIGRSGEKNRPSMRRGFFPQQIDSGFVERRGGLSKLIDFLDVHARDLTNRSKSVNQTDLYIEKEKSNEKKDEMREERRERKKRKKTNSEGGIGDERHSKINRSTTDFVTGGDIRFVLGVGDVDNKGNLLVGEFLSAAFGNWRKVKMRKRKEEGREG